MITNVPLWYLVAAAVTVNVIAWLVIPGARQRERERRIRFGHCPECDYDLRESPNRCPECGTEVKQKVREPIRK